MIISQAVPGGGQERRKLRIMTDDQKHLHAMNAHSTAEVRCLKRKQKHGVSETRSGYASGFFLRRSLIVCLLLLLTRSRASSFQQHPATPLVDHVPPLHHDQPQPPQEQKEHQQGPLQSNRHSLQLITAAAATEQGTPRLESTLRRDGRRTRDIFGRTSSKLRSTTKRRLITNGGFQAPTKTSFRTNATTTATTPERIGITPQRVSSPAGYSDMNSPLIDESNEEYQRRKEEWARRYTTLEGLRDAFGSNRNKLWGDLDASMARRLYKSLLPTALCELVLDLGVRPEELAHLAYKARKAAKLYSRERCTVPARIGANLFDGWRQFRKYGRFQPAGMSYDQIWDKYRSLIEEDLEDDIRTEEEIVAQTCLKILERSCKTNERIDQIFLTPKNAIQLNDNEQAQEDLRRIALTLEMDVRRLLDPTSWDGWEEDAEGTAPSSHHQRSDGMGHVTQQQYHALKLFLMLRRRVGPEESGGPERKS